MNSSICVKNFLEIGAPECTAREHPSNGNVLVSASFAEYHCVKGYVLKGIRRLVCSDDGIWNGVPPLCLSKKWAMILHVKMFMITKSFEILLTSNVIYN